MTSSAALLGNHPPFRPHLGAGTTRRIFRASADSYRTVSGPRGIRLADGSLLVSAMRSSRLGSNDFHPFLLRGDAEGETWSGAEDLFPSQTRAYSIFGQIGRGGGERELLFFGTRCRRDAEGEDFWDDELKLMKANELVWARSEDDGATWSDLHPIALPVAYAAEVTSPICVSRSGRWLACFAPHPTLEFRDNDALNRIILMISEDQGISWRPGTMLVSQAHTSTAEAWVVETTGGVLVGSAWQIGHGEDVLPNLFAVSRDGGETWSPAQSTGTLGQSTTLLALPDGGVLFGFNHRSREPIGIGAKRVGGDADFVGAPARLVWAAQHDGMQSGKTPGFENWKDFSFGEPSFVGLGANRVLLLFWNAVDGLGGVQALPIDLTEWV